MNEIESTTQSSVMTAITAGSVKMHSRWYFMVQSAIFGVGILVMIGLVVYIVSLAVFVTDRSGVWQAPRYGWQGWLLLLRSVPWLLLVATVLLAVVLEFLARRFSFIYSRPLVYSFVVIVVAVSAAGALVAHTSLHESLARGTRGIPFIRGWYKYYDPEQVRGAYRGRVVNALPSGFILESRSGHTTTIMITPATRLPPRPLRADDQVLIIGFGETSTISAWGIRLLPTRK
jgi:hypothetical protein